MKPEEILARLERNIRFKKPYGFMLNDEREIYEAELECLGLARRNIAIQPAQCRCGVCRHVIPEGANFCSNCGQRIKE